MNAVLALSCTSVACQVDLFCPLRRVSRGRGRDRVRSVTALGSYSGGFCVHGHRANGIWKQGPAALLLGSGWRGALRPGPGSRFRLRGSEGGVFDRKHRLYSSCPDSVGIATRNLRGVGLTGTLVLCVLRALASSGERAAMAWGQCPDRDTLRSGAHVWLVELLGDPHRGRRWYREGSVHGHRLLVTDAGQYFRDGPRRPSRRASHTNHRTLSRANQEQDPWI